MADVNLKDAAVSGRTIRTTDMMIGIDPGVVDAANATRTDTLAQVIGTILENFPPNASTETSGSSTDTVINVDSAAGFAAGQVIKVGSEYAVIQSIAGNAITLAAALASAPAADVAVSGLTDTEKSAIRTAINAASKEERYKDKAVGADYSITAGDMFGVVRQSGTISRTFTLPAISGALTVGDWVIVRAANVDCTVDGNGSETINGAAALVIPGKQSVIFYVVGSNWQTLGFIGAVKPGVANKSASYTLVASDRDQAIIFGGSSALTATLPDITGTVEMGWRAWILSGGTHDLTIDGNGSDTIDGAQTRILPKGHALLIQAVTGSSWAVVCSTDGAVWDGKYRSLTGRPAGASASFVTGVVLNITPETSGAVIRVRGSVMGGAEVGNNRYIVPVARRKIGTGSWTGLNGSGQFTVLGTPIYQAPQYYIDWMPTQEVFDIPIRPNTTSNVRVALGLAVINEHSISSTHDAYFNRAGAGDTNWLTNAEAVTWLEVTQRKAAGSITTSTTTSRDADDATN